MSCVFISSWWQQSENINPWPCKQWSAFILMRGKINCFIQGNEYAIVLHVLSHHLWSVGCSHQSLAVCVGADAWVWWSLWVTLVVFMGAAASFWLTVWVLSTQFVGMYGCGCLSSAVSVGVATTVWQSVWVLPPKCGCLCGCWCLTLGSVWVLPTGFSSLFRCWWLILAVCMGAVSSLWPTVWVLPPQFDGLCGCCHLYLAITLGGAIGSC